MAFVHLWEDKLPFLNHEEIVALAFRPGAPKLVHWLERSGIPPLALHYQFLGLIECMNTPTNPQNGHGHLPFDHRHTPYWKLAHHDWRFWVGATLAFAAMLIYVMSFDLAWRPRTQKPQLLRPGVVAK